MPQIRHAARPDGRVFLVVDDIFIDHLAIAWRFFRWRIILAPIERPSAAVHIRRIGGSGERFGNNLVEALLAFVIDLANGARERPLDRRRSHQRVERGLAAAAFDDHFQIATQNFFGLRREVENHIDVERFEIWRRNLNGLKDAFPGTVLVVTVHLLQQTIVKTLHANAQAIDSALQLIEVFRNEVVRIGLARDFLNGKLALGHIDEIAQLVNHDGRRAAANIKRIEIVPELLDHHEFGAQVLEIRNRPLFRKRKAIEAAIRAQTLAKRNMGIEHIALAGIRARNARLGTWFDVHESRGACSHGGSEQAFAQHALRPQRAKRDIATILLAFEVDFVARLVGQFACVFEGIGQGDHI